MKSLNNVLKGESNSQEIKTLTKKKTKQQQKHLQLDSGVQQQQQQQQNTDHHQNILNNILNRYKLIHFLILSSLLYCTVMLQSWV